MDRDRTARVHPVQDPSSKNLSLLAISEGRASGTQIVQPRARRPWRHRVPGPAQGLDARTFPHTSGDPPVAKHGKHFLDSRDISAIGYTARFDGGSPDSAHTKNRRE